MDARQDVLANEVRARRVAIDNDLEVIRVRLRLADPRRLDPRRWVPPAVSVAAGTALVWLWAKRRRAKDPLRQLLVHGLTELYHAERQLGPAFDRMSGKVSNPDLGQALAHARNKTQDHVERLERVFRSIGARPARARSRAIAAIVRDGERQLKGRKSPEARDAWAIAVAQRIAHVEIAGYGTARTYAETLGRSDAAQLLQQTLDEERAADERLTQLAERFVNPRAVGSE